MSIYEVDEQVHEHEPIWLPHYEVKTDREMNGRSEERLRCSTYLTGLQMDDFAHAGGSDQQRV